MATRLILEIILRLSVGQGIRPLHTPMATASSTTDTDQQYEIQTAPWR